MTLADIRGVGVTRRRKIDLSSLSVDELTELYERIRSLLTGRIQDEKRKLEEQLAELNRKANDEFKRDEPKSKRNYPAVLPKFRNPADPSQTWAGRGKQPRWLVSELKAGKKAEDFLIDRRKR